MINEQTLELVNYRIKAEENSSRIYKAMSVWLENKGYTNSAKLFKKYSDEELVHANWSYTYLLDLGITPKVPALDQPQTEFVGLVEILNLAHEHEVLITKECELFAKTAMKSSDVMTFGIAQKFVAEQIDELSKTINLLDWVNVLGGENITPEGLMLLDNKIGTLL